MADSAVEAEERAEPASFDVPMRTLGRIRAGTYVYGGDELTTGWHRHDLHQLEYAIQGIAEVETQGWRYLLPPRQAIWIPAGLPHCTTLCRVRSIAVFFDPATHAFPADRARVIATPAVLREMMCYATRWSIVRSIDEDDARTFFAALAAVTRDELHRELPFRLPTTDDPVCRSIMEHTRADLGRSEAAVCRAAGVSARTLRRRFPAVASMSWHEYRTAARVLGAISLMSAQTHLGVTEVAHAVGYTNVNAFTRAFRAATGITPSLYRRRQRQS